ncbi:hypothetical protein GCM10008905_08220 [Clostridium malenominatum]|uniref:Polymerase beta nucleotidyltransferase domain-containing protein n=1 Tax=Clostridium malenominatum TaxID=1539 RepID=A0ABP3U0T2_9CLOT
MLNKEFINGINEVLIEKINPYLIYVFGSAAKGLLREDSDIDIAFLSEENLSDYQVFMVAQELASSLNRDIDLIDLKKASTVFKAQILGTGIKIYCTDKTRRMYFEMRSLKEYALLNEEREIILKGIKERGGIYG